MGKRPFNTPRTLINHSNIASLNFRSFAFPFSSTVTKSFLRRFLINKFIIFFEARFEKPKIYKGRGVGGPNNSGKGAFIRDLRVCSISIPPENVRNAQKSSGFMTFSRGIGIEHWLKMVNHL